MKKERSILKLSTFLILIIAASEVDATKIIENDLNAPSYNLTESMLTAKYVSVAFCDK